MLGSGRSLSANVAAFPLRDSSLLSPYTSSVSVNSSTSTSKRSTIDAEDLNSRISLEQINDNDAAVNAAETSLVCPICNEEMVRSVHGSAILYADRY